MIQRDFILRQVQELAQLLARSLFLRARREYETALSEIGRALRQLEADKDLNQMSVEDWITLCRRHGYESGPLMLAVGDVLREQAAVLDSTGRPQEAERSRELAVALQLETILSGDIALTQERLEQTDGAIAELKMELLAPGTLGRLFAYNVERGRWSAAEDILFDWAERGDPAAKIAGRAFYNRLGQLSEEELAAGGLAPDEVADGLQDLERLN
jgi:hypothetical protein